MDVRSAGQAGTVGTLASGKYDTEVFFKADPLQGIGKVPSVVLTVNRGHPFAHADYRFAPPPAHED
jgi:hypothetical protein